MPIEFNCYDCGKLLHTSDEKAGRSVSCPSCGASLTIPDERAEAADEYHDNSDRGGDEFDDYDEGFAPSAASQPRRPYRERGSQNTLALVSMITGISGLAVIIPGFCCGCLLFLSLPLNLAAIVTGTIALIQIRDEGGEGKPQALTGIICAAIALLVFVLMIVVGVAANLMPRQLNF